ncbi:uncharacterized protein LOC126716877 isoform X3 [Quercus robur]|uniref:uncharacterized protein LOC126716877 isoform X2 n=1 Tax=Quercus robur TaxID=38942 RepID=UPI002162AEC3|nr:uncharacterized protein LOC126716877 isoform X2 [Quercus robur]XP_050273873.1 uncharacterized protein LOC126716877 isoform X3 [Quercus robur]
MAEILSPQISPILLLARLRQYCELRFVKMYWQCMRRRRRKRHHCQNGIWNGMVRKDLQVDWAKEHRTACHTRPCCVPDVAVHTTGKAGKIVSLLLGWGIE